MLISSHRKLLSSKAMVVNVAEKSGQDSDRPLQSVEIGLGDVKTGGWPDLRDSGRQLRKLEFAAGPFPSPVAGEFSFVPR